jgi:polar amino acid transport system permease protein
MSIANDLIPPQPPPPVTAFRWTGLRILGATLLGLWILAGIALVLWLIDAWDIDKVTTYGPKFLSGLGTTLTLVGISITLGACCRFPSPSAACRQTASCRHSPMAMSTSSAAHR